jgi:C-5 cytosine-specific DNA methylase
MPPLAIDLFCGLGGWTEGLLAEGYDVVGFDIERHQYGDRRYPGLLVIQDVTTLHGSQFKNAAVIVASPPCQEYSYMAMPWKVAKAKAAAIRADKTGLALERLNRLFNACLRIQREACEAAGHHIPLIIENVKGAQPWVGRARWSFGSFYLWGDVPALMPVALRRSKSSGMNWSDRSKRGQDFTRIAGEQAVKNNGGSWFNVAHNTTSGKAQNPVHDGLKGKGGTWFHEYGPGQGARNFNSKSPKRKALSAMIAKIPLPLSRHIAATFRP